MQLICDHQCSPAWPHRLLNSAGTSRVPAACCHTPPATAAGPEGGFLLKASRHTGGLSLCQSVGDWPFEPPDIPKWTETIMWYLTDPHRGIFFSLAPQCREVKAQGELYNCTPGADRNCWSVLVKSVLSLPAGWMLKRRFFCWRFSRKLTACYRTKNRCICKVAIKVAIGLVPYHVKQTSGITLPFCRLNVLKTQRKGVKLVQRKENSFCFTTSMESSPTKGFILLFMFYWSEVTVYRSEIMRILIQTRTQTW